MDEDRWLHADDEQLARGSLEKTGAAIRVFVERYRSVLVDRLRAATDRYGELPVRLEEVGDRIVCSISMRFLEWPGSPESRPSMRELLDRHEVEDLVLAMACAKGSNRAWAVFDRRHREFIRSSAYQFARKPVDVDEIVESFYADLYLPLSDGRSSISRFEGRSKLSTWLRAVLYRRITDCYSRRRSIVSINSVEGAADGLSVRAASASRGWRMESSPEEELHARQVCARVCAALRRAVDALSESERELLHDYYFSRRTVIEIGKSRGVHKASVSRWLKQLRAKVQRELRRDLGSYFPRSEEEIASFLESLGREPSANSTVGA